MTPMKAPWQPAQIRKACRARNRFLRSYHAALVSLDEIAASATQPKSRSLANTLIAPFLFNFIL